MNKQTKATSIPKSVKCNVFKRDGYCCILCGSPQGQPNAHYIPRSQGGLGIEENIITLCPDCHREYDQSDKRSIYGERIRQYLIRQYPEWNAKKLKYKKWSFTNDQ